MRMFSSDAADGVHNVIYLCVAAGERVGQSDVRKRVVGAIPADLMYIHSLFFIRGIVKFQLVLPLKNS